MTPQRGGLFVPEGPMRYPRSIIFTEDQLNEAVEYFSRQDAFAYDIESTGPHRGIASQNDVIWISLATHGMTVVIPMGHPIGDNIIGQVKVPTTGPSGKTRNVSKPVWDAPPVQLRRSVVFAALKKLFHDPGIIKVAHFQPMDAISIAKYIGGPPVPPLDDTLVLAHLLDENRLNGLKPLTKSTYGVDYDKEGVGKCVEKYAFSKVARYSYLDAKYCWLLYRRLSLLIPEQGLEAVLELEREVLEVVIDMGITGAPISVPWLTKLRTELSAELEEREATVYRAAGQEFNVNSSQQKAHILFGPKREGGQGLRPHKLTDGGEKKAKADEKLLPTDYSTDAESLKKHAKNKVAAAILAYQETRTLLSTFVIGYLGDPQDPDKPCIIFDGRVYTTFGQTGTGTGRFSSRKPNLQNIPIRTESGAKIRRSFAAPPGKRLVVGDYGQIELVLLAHFAGPGALWDAFVNGDDPHRITAARILGIPGDQVTPHQRQTYGKTINFLIGYGGGPGLLAEKAEITRREAEETIADHRAAFPEIYKFKSKLLKVAGSRLTPYVKTFTGRRRRVPDLNSPETGLRLRAERQLINSVIQGSAGDLNKMSMVNTKRLLRQAGLQDRAKLILTVHDEIVTEVDEQIADHVAEIMREAMIGPDMQALVNVPMTADIKVVEYWSAAK